MNNKTGKLLASTLGVTALLAACGPTAITPTPRLDTGNLPPLQRTPIPTLATGPSPEPDLKDSDFELELQQIPLIYDFSMPEEAMDYYSQYCSSALRLRNGSLHGIQELALNPDSSAIVCERNFPDKPSTSFLTVLINLTDSDTDVTTRLATGIAFDTTDTDVTITPARTTLGTDGRPVLTKNLALANRISIRTNQILGSTIEAPLYELQNPETGITIPFTFDLLIVFTQDGRWLIVISPSPDNPKFWTGPTGKQNNPIRGTNAHTILYNQWQRRTIFHQRK